MIILKATKKQSFNIESAFLENNWESQIDPLPPLP